MELTTIHPAVAELDPATAVETSPIPLHPGAIAHHRVARSHTAGILIDDFDNSIRAACGADAATAVPRG